MHEIARALQEEDGGKRSRRGACGQIIHVGSLKSNTANASRRKLAASAMWMTFSAPSPNAIPVMRASGTPINKMSAATTPRVDRMCLPTKIDLLARVVDVDYSVLGSTPKPHRDDGHHERRAELKPAGHVEQLQKDRTSEHREDGPKLCCARHDTPLPPPANVRTIKTVLQQPPFNEGQPLPAAQADRMRKGTVGSTGIAMPTTPMANAASAPARQRMLRVWRSTQPQTFDDVSSIA